MKKRFIVAALAIAVGDPSQAVSRRRTARPHKVKVQKKQMAVRKYLLFSLVLRLRQLTLRSIHQLTEETIFCLPLTIF